MTHPPSQQDDPTSVLFHQQVSVAVLGSGSKGNATYVGDGRCGLLIDCGLSTKQIFKRMEAIGLSGAPLDAVLITHEHSDHVAAAGVLDRTVTRRTGGTIPFFMTRGTAANVNPKCRPTLVQTITAGRAFPWRGWRIEPYTIPHDTRDPVAYTLTIGKLRIGVVTDLGRATTLVTQQLGSLDIAVLEFNHDRDMLMDGEYPWHLKQRIRGPHGHLSNRQAAQMLASAVNDRMKHLVLAHLSEDNNAPDKAMDLALRALNYAGASQVNVHLGNQVQPVGPICMNIPRELKSTRARRRRQSRANTSEPPNDEAAQQISLFGK